MITNRKMDARTPYAYGILWKLPGRVSLFANQCSLVETGPKTATNNQGINPSPTIVLSYLKLKADT